MTQTVKVKVTRKQISMYLKGGPNYYFSLPKEMVLEIPIEQIEFDNHQTHIHINKRMEEELKRKEPDWPKVECYEGTPSQGKTATEVLGYLQENEEKWKRKNQPKRKRYRVHCVTPRLDGEIISLEEVE